MKQGLCERILNLSALSHCKPMRGVHIRYKQTVTPFLCQRLSTQGFSSSPQIVRSFSAQQLNCKFLSPWVCRFAWLRTGDGLGIKAASTARFHGDVQMQRCISTGLHLPGESLEGGMDVVVVCWLLNVPASG